MPCLFDSEISQPSQRSASKITGDRAAVNPAAADPPMPVPGLHHHPNIPAANRQLPPAARLLINCGIFLVATAGSSIVFHTAGDPSAIDGPAYALVAFLPLACGLTSASSEPESRYCALRVTARRGMINLIHSLYRYTVATSCLFVCRVYRRCSP